MNKTKQKKKDNTSVEKAVFGNTVSQHVKQRSPNRSWCEQSKLTDIM